MTEAIVRNLPEFNVSLEVSDGEFVKPPKESQRKWLLRRALDEVVGELYHLDQTARNLVPGSQRVLVQEGWQKSQAQYDESQLVILGQQVMQEWERPAMKAMAEAAAAAHGDILEIGFGMGISATYIQEIGVRSYTVVEFNEGVIDVFEKWRSTYPDRDIKVIPGKWQDVQEQFGLYDGIFFDAYPTSEEEITAYIRNSATFAQAFFPVAARCLRPGGVFTYFTDEVDSLSRSHQRAVLEHFSAVTLSVVKPLFPPEDCNYWWADSMVVAKAFK